MVFPFFLLTLIPSYYIMKPSIWTLNTIHVWYLIPMLIPINDPIYYTNITYYTFILKWELGSYIYVNRCKTFPIFHRCKILFILEKLNIRTFHLKIYVHFKFTIIFTLCLMMGKSHQWSTFQNCEAKFCYHLLLSTLFCGWPHLGAYGLFFHLMYN